MKNGKRTETRVDDNFYTKNENFIYCGCTSQKYLWMPLIEKAWAKANSTKF